MLAASRVSAALLLAFACAAGCGFDWTVPKDDGGHGSSGAGGSGATSTTGATSSTSATGSTTTTSTGSTSATTSATTGATTSSSSGGVVCDTLGTCDACATCAEDGLCKAAVDACFANPECTAYDDCQWNCLDLECLDDCAATYPNGEALWYAAAYCVSCDACPGTCADACASL